MTAQMEASGASARQAEVQQASDAQGKAAAPPTTGTDGVGKKQPRGRRFAHALPAARERSMDRLHRRRPGDEESPRGLSPGPLAHQSSAPAPVISPQAVEGVKSVAGVADRILAGVNGRGEATAVIELGAGDWAGTQVSLVAGAKGLEVTVYAATDAARRVVQAKMSSLARALAERGIAPKKLEVSVRHRDNRGGSRQDGRR